MDNTYRIKTKIGEHEFEAEGPPDFVQEQFRIFKEMVASAATSRPANPQITFPAPPKASTIPEPEKKPDAVEGELHKIMKFDDAERVVSLTVRPSSAEDAILVILLGQRVMLGTDSVTGGVIMEGITATGALQVSRVDRLLEKLGRDGDVIVLGQRRSKTYRLTNAGINRAREIAEALVFMVP